MEVFILDDLFRRVEVVDRFESCIWTERFSALGDFQLVMHSNPVTKRLLAKGTYLAMNKSKRVMQVENAEDKDDSEGRSLLTVSGRSLESVMTKRTTRTGYNLAPAVLAENYTKTGLPATIARDLIRDFLYDNDLDLENIPYLQPPEITLYRPDTIAEPSTSITAVIENGQLYDELKKLTDAYGLGIRLYRGPDNGKLYCNIYSGNDRTATQVALPAVIFSPGLDNLSESSELSSIENEYNVAYVVGKDRGLIVPTALTDVNVSGFDRKILWVKADDITGVDSVAIDRLTQRGREELSKYKPMQAIDGQLSQNSRYVYDVDYSLGDLVEIRNEEGLTHRMRVTEQIFMDDAQGERSYPTLAADVFITAGSWAAWDTSGVWDTAVGEWNDQPV